jgi:hypothetical protein
VTGTGGLRFAGSSGNAWPSDGASASILTPREPVELKSPAYGAAIPPNDSHGELFCRFCSDVDACSGLTGTGFEPPSM